MFTKDTSFFKPPVIKILWWTEANLKGNKEF